MRLETLPPPRVIAVDVDGTLHVDGISNQRLTTWLEEQRAAGYSLMLWSMRGEEYARRAAIHCKADHLFDLICSKPGYIRRHGMAMDQADARRYVAEKLGPS